MFWGEPFLTPIMINVSSEACGLIMTCVVIFNYQSHHGLAMALCRPPPQSPLWDLTASRSVFMIYSKLF